MIVTGESKQGCKTRETPLVGSSACELTLYIAISDDDDDEDDTAELLRELEKIKRERAEEKERQERLQREEEEKEREAQVAAGNPLLNMPDASSSAPKDFSVKRRWDDDVIFKNQARGMDDKPKKRFINDTLRSDFHRKFMSKYVQ